MDSSDDLGGSVFRSTDKSMRLEPAKYKVICVGESMVGKTSLIQRYVGNVFMDQCETTISWDFKTKMVQLVEEGDHGQTIAGDMVKLFVWDTAG